MDKERALKELNDLWSRIYDIQDKITGLIVDLEIELDKGD